jgi:hypothetical protein
MDYLGQKHHNVLKVRTDSGFSMDRPMRIEVKIEANRNRAI